MEITTTITGFVALYIFLLAAFAGYEIIGRVPAILRWNRSSALLVYC